MSLPDYVMIVPNPADMPVRWPGFPHTIALLPGDKTLAGLRASPAVWATFLVEPDSAPEVLNGVALSEYIRTRKPVLIHARKARDLRPFLRRGESFLRRGYAVEVLA